MKFGLTYAEQIEKLRAEFEYGYINGIRVFAFFPIRLSHGNYVWLQYCYKYPCRYSKNYDYYIDKQDRKLPE